MAARVLTADHYDAVRALIAPDVTEAHISDDYLSQQPFAPKAERKVRKRLISAERELRKKGFPTAEINVDALRGANLEDARLAMMHECMTVLCLTVPQMLRQTELEVITEVQNIDWKEKRAYHTSERDDLINDIIESVKEDTTTQSASRALPFGAVGTQRSEKGEPAYPYTRRWK